MVSLSLCRQFETSLVSYRKVIELLLQLQGTKAHGDSYIKVNSHLVRHLLGNCLLIATQPTLHVKCRLKTLPTPTIL